MFSIIPKDEKYFSLLTSLAVRVHSGCEIFVKLFDDYSNHASYATEIKGVEVNCDTIAAKITGKLNTSFITPIDREDIYLLVKELDDVIDLINNLAIRFEMYSVTSLRPEAREMAHILLKCTAEVSTMFEILEKHGDPAAPIKETNALEKQADNIYRSAVRGLFQQEKDPIEVIKWTSIYESLETAVDRCKDVAEAVEAVVVKNK